MKVIRRSLGLLLLVWLCWAVPAGAEPVKGQEIDLGGCDFVFVDAENNTGYYVDLNEQCFRNATEVTARVQIVKADRKQLYLYTVYFNRRRQIYQVLRSVIADYDSKLIIGGTDKPMRPVFYEPTSMMGIVAEFIFNPSQAG